MNFSQTAKCHFLYDLFTCVSSSNDLSLNLLYHDVHHSCIFFTGGILDVNKMKNKILNFDEMLRRSAQTCV